jgi:hypothetical protein
MVTWDGKEDPENPRNWCTKSIGSLCSWYRCHAFRKIPTIGFDCYPDFVSAFIEATQIAEMFGQMQI